MTKHLLVLLTASAAVLGASACTPEQKAMNTPPGTYKSTTTSTDANGTTYKTKDVTDVTVDEYGNKKAVVKSKTTKDPKGLFNKTTSSSEQVIEEK